MKAPPPTVGTFSGLKRAKISGSRSADSSGGRFRLRKVGTSALLFGRQHYFIVSNRVAQGSFGKLRYAVDEDGKAWAIKELRTGEEARSRAGKLGRTKATVPAAVKREIDVMLACGAVIEEVLDVGGNTYVVLPLADGDIASLGVVDCHLVRLVARDIFEALRGVHAAGYLHRDVKPANLLYDRYGKTSLADYGLAHSQSRHLRRRGTPSYRAPETFSFEKSAPKFWSQDVGTASDIWSAGVTLCRMLWDRFLDPMLGLDVAGIEGVLPAYHEWYETHRIGTLSTKELQTFLDADTSEFGAYYSQVCNVDPVLLHFILTRLMHPDPSQRAAHDEIEMFFRSGGRGEPDIRRAEAELRSLRTTDERDAVLDQLRLRGREIQPERGE